MMFPAISIHAANVSLFGIPQFNAERSFAQQYFNDRPDPLAAQWSGAWQRCKQRFFKSTPLTQSLNALNTPAFDFSQNWGDHCETILTALKSQAFATHATALRNIIKKLNHVQLNSLFQRMTLLSLKEFPAESILFENCTKLFTLAELTTFLQTSFPNYLESDVLAATIRAELAPFMADDAKRSQFAQHKNYFKRLVNHLVETLLSAFNFFKAGSKVEGTFHASYLLATYRDLFITLPLQVFVLLQLCLQNTFYALVGAPIAVIALFALAILYVKKIKPRPEDLSYCKNLVDEARKGNLKPVFGREKELKALIDQLKKGKNRAHRHPIFIGPSGVGKSETINALALHMFKGGDPFFKNKALHRVDIPNLAHDNFGNTDKVKILSEQLENHEEEIILVCEELAAAFRGDGAMANRLLELFDRLPFLTGSMTLEDFNKYVCHNEVFRRRFQPIYLHSTGKDETIKILKETLNEENTYFSPAILEKIYSLTLAKLSKYPQPMISLQVLYETIDFLKIESQQLQLLQEKMQALKFKHVEYKRRQYLGAASLEKTDRVGREALTRMNKRLLLDSYYVTPQMNQELQDVQTELIQLSEGFAEKLTAFVDSSIEKEVKANVVGDNSAP